MNEKTNDNLEDHTVEELKTIAEKEGADISGQTVKADIIKAIKQNRKEKNIHGTQAAHGGGTYSGPQTDFQKVTEAEKLKRDPHPPGSMAKAKLDAERSEKGGDVPEGERGKPTDAREYTALERERQLKEDRSKFEAEWNKKHSTEHAPA
jgi:hypothetical protein